MRPLHLWHITLAVHLVVVKGQPRNRTASLGGTIPDATVTPAAQNSPLLESNQGLQSYNPMCCHYTKGSRLIAFACCRSSCRRPRGGRGIEPRSEEFQSPVFPVHQLPRTPPPGLEPGAAERQSAMLPLHQGGPHSILFVCCRSCCRRSSSDRDSTSGSVHSLM